MNVRHAAVAFLVLALAGAGHFFDQRPGTADRRPAAAPIVGRSVVSTTFGIVAASQPLAARAGVQILERGGNAIDAAIAANATIGLMEPTGNGLGGDLFIIYYEAKSGTVYGLNSSGWAPTGLTPDFLAAKGIKEMPQRGIYSVTVPGVAAGWDAMRTRFGTKPFSELLAPAIWYAENGFPVSEKIASSWAGSVKMHSAHPNSRKTYLIDGERAPKAGEIFKNPDLAGSLRLIAEKGRDGYYKGKTAEAILAISREQGGTFTAADLGEFQPEWVTPIKTSYRGWNVYEIGPQTQGISALMMLNLMEPYPMARVRLPQHQRAARDDRSQEARLRRHAALHRRSAVHAQSGGRAPEQAARDRSREADRSDQGRLPGRAGEAARHHRRAGQRHDLHVRDRQGRQHRVADPEQLQRLRLGPGAAGHRLHAAEPRRAVLARRRTSRTRSRRTSGRCTRSFRRSWRTARQRIGFGIMGGWNQGQAHAQFVANIVDYGMTIQQALEAGRFTKGSFEGCDVQIESLVPEKTREELKARGHELRVVQPRSGTFGYGQAVMSGPGGVHFGASEPRHDGAAIPQAPPVFEAVARREQ